MVVIGIVGLIGSGKDTAAEYIAKKYNYLIISYRDVIAEIMQRIGLETNRENMQRFAREARDKHGEDVFAKKVLEKIKKSKNKKIIVKEMRTEGDLLTIRRNLGSFFVIEVFAEEKLRYERLKKRKRLGDPKNFEEFLIQQKREEELGYTKSLEYADYCLENNGSLKELYEKIDKLMRFFK